MAGPYIFQTTTCLKSEFVSRFTEIMTAAGWANISSNPATDFMVFHSTGEDGTKNLVFQLRETNTAGTAGTAITTSGYVTMSYRLPSGYTPGAPGVAGAFARLVAAEPWKALHVASDTAGAATVPASTLLTLRYHVNKNRIMLSIENSTAVLPVFWYIGLPDVQYATESGSKGVLIAQSYVSGAVNTAYVTDAPDEGGAQTNSTTRKVSYSVSDKNPNLAGRYHMSEVYISDAVEGVRFKLEGFYLLPPMALISGDIITIGAASYYVLVCGGTTSSSFGSPVNYIAYQIS